MRLIHYDNYNIKLIAKFPITSEFIEVVTLGPPASKAADKPRLIINIINQIKMITI